MSRRRSTLAALSVASLAAAVVPALAVAAPPPERVGSYVVVLSPSAGAPGAAADRLSSRHGGDVGFVYRHALRGFVLTASSSAASAIARNPHVDYVESVSSVSATDQATPTGVQRAGATANSKLDIDQSDDVRVDADVAVLDTGIDLDHPDLHVTGGTSCLNVISVSSCAGSGDDNQGHGTHVAGSAAAVDNGIGVVGVAPGARLWSVKVLDSRGSGSNAGVAAGLDWVVQHNASTPDSSGDIEVANLSLTGGKSSVMDDAVARAVSSGVTVVVAAGNDGRDAGSYSPASAPAAITVSALADFNGAPGGGAAYTCYPDVDDTLADYSNYGSVVDVIAPGTCIRSTTMGGGYGTKSGTSMASPHVAGAAALLRSMGKSHATTETQLKDTGSTLWGGDRDGVKEPLLTLSDSNVFAPTLVPQTTPPPSTGLTFSGSASNQKSTWTATVSVAGGTPGSSYSGSWSVGGGQTSCVANGSGACQISRTGIAKKTGSATWTYAGSPATTVTVSKP